MQIAEAAEMSLCGSVVCWPKSVRVDRRHVCDLLVSDRLTVNWWLSGRQAPFSWPASVEEQWRLRRPATPRRAGLGLMASQRGDGISPGSCWRRGARAGAPAAPRGAAAASAAAAPRKHSGRGPFIEFTWTNRKRVPALQSP